MSFLNSLLPLPEHGLITSLTYLPTEQIPNIPILKRTIVDVKCTDQRGQIFIVEMLAQYREGINCVMPPEGAHQDSLKYFIPDSYDFCPCASGKKYKFCCKRIFREVMGAMTAAEEGKLSEALEWITKAKYIIGETAEVICREAIVYSFFNIKKSEEILDKCLAINPNHPRSHYLRGIMLNDQGDIQGAIVEYEMAIANYPKSDHFHLNEAYNNLGTAFHALNDLTKAKIAWEQALVHLPSDKMTKRNLEEFIYNKPIGSRGIYRNGCTSKFSYCCQ